MNELEFHGDILCLISNDVSSESKLNPQIIRWNIDEMG